MSMAINKVSSQSQGAVAYDWREHAHEKGYNQPVAHLSCLDTNYLIPQMSGEESSDIST